MTLAPDDTRHGLNGYNNLNCRCDVCRAANRAYQREYRRRQAKVLLAADDPRHGTVAAYTNYRCRCPRCREAQRTYAAQHRVVSR